MAQHRCRSSRRPGLAGSLVVLLSASLVLGAEPPSIDVPSIEPAVVSTDVAPSAVTVYLGRAAATRRLARDLDAGIHAIRFEGLPPAFQPGSIQARANAPVRVLGVDEELASPPGPAPTQVEALDREIARLAQQLARLAEDRMGLEADADLIESIGVRTTADATADGGTAQLDLDVVRQQLEFVRGERTRVIEARRKLDDRERTLQAEHAALLARRDAMTRAGDARRTAVVTVAVPVRVSAVIELTYLVADATWTPAYNIRGDLGDSIVTVEYDALLTQQTGEDWNDVALTLSTAEPSLAANPPAIEPWYVDLQLVTPVLAAARYQATEFRSADKRRSADAAYAAIDELAADASVEGEGPAVSFQLPRRVTVPADAETTQRTRIANLAAGADFIHVAVPLHTDSVYVRGELVNDSAYVLLPGEASVFLGPDYIGPTSVGTVAPGSEFDVHFGIDRNVRVTRTLVSRKTSRTGLLNDGRRTRSDYRIDVDNATDSSLALEIVDRIPVSRTDQITIDLVNLGTPLATDADYLETDRPHGILKWALSVPTTARGTNALAITWGVRIDRSKKVETTELPD